MAKHKFNNALRNMGPKLHPMKVKLPKHDVTSPRGAKAATNKKS